MILQGTLLKLKFYKHPILKDFTLWSKVISNCYDKSIMRINFNAIIITIIGLFIFKIAVADVVRDRVKKENKSTNKISYIK